MINRQNFPNGTDTTSWCGVKSARCPECATDCSPAIFFPAALHRWPVAGCKLFATTSCKRRCLYRSCCTIRDPTTSSSWPQQRLSAIIHRSLSWNGILLWRKFMMKSPAFLRCANTDGKITIITDLGTVVVPLTTTTHSRPVPFSSFTSLLAYVAQTAGRAIPAQEYLVRRS